MDERGLPSFYTAAGGLAGGLARRPMRGGDDDESRAHSRFGARAVVGILLGSAHAGAVSPNATGRPQRDDALTSRVDASPHRDTCTNPDPSNHPGNGRRRASAQGSVVGLQVGQGDPPDGHKTFLPFVQAVEAEGYLNKSGGTWFDRRRALRH